MRKFHENLRRIRLQLDLTQAEAAQKCGLPIPNGQVRWSRWEKGYRSPCPSQIQAIIDGLDIDPEELFR